MKHGAIVVALSAAMLAGCHGSGSVSGDYLATGHDHVMQIQLVEDASEHVTGVLTTYSIGRDSVRSSGSLNRDTTNVSGGFVNGNNLVLILGRNSIFTSQRNVVG
ncbi:MAG: hypothetical protein L0H29_01790, partial [Sinobacteraceae bacterium]|nr:hypothetical protein [Nevskiaceae bacterium]